MAKPTGSTVNSSALYVFEVLRFVADMPEPLGVTEIGRRLSLPVSTVFRALTTLEDAGYIQRFQNAPRFEIGTMPYLLNRALLSRFALHGESRPVLYELAQTSEDTISLWMRLGWYGVRIGGAFGRRDTHHHARLGDVVLLHTHPAGRTMLTMLPDNEQSDYAQFVANHHADSAASLDNGWPHPGGGGEVRRERTEPDSVRSSSVAIRDQNGAVVGCLASDGAAGGDDPSLDQRLCQARDTLEALIAAAPERYRSPFAHIPADKIQLNLASISHAKR